MAVVCNGGVFLQGMSCCINKSRDLFHCCAEIQAPPNLLLMTSVFQLPIICLIASVKSVPLLGHFCYFLSGIFKKWRNIVSFAVIYETQHVHVMIKFVTAIRTRG